MQDKEKKSKGKKSNEDKGDELNVQIEEVEQEYTCCDAKLFMIPERKKWMLTLCLIQIPTILHEILHVEWFSHNHYFGALYVLFIAQFLNFWTFMNLCMKDPGFIQKIKYGYEIDENFIKIPKNQHINNYIVVSYVAVARQQTQRIKLCSTCNIYRPSRASHCSQCGVCVERMDHHCPWIGTCIGKRNYLHFYVFLLSLCILIINVMVMCIMLMSGTEEDPEDLGERLRIYPMSIVFFIFPCVPGILFGGIMLGFHTMLTLKDMTTRQFLEQKWSPSVGNPERKNNCIKGFIKILIQARSVNPKYKHQAFPYYNNDPDSSSNTGGHRNSKNSDPEAESRKKKQSSSSFSEESLHKANQNPGHHHIVRQKEIELEVEDQNNLPEVNTEQKFEE